MFKKLKNFKRCCSTSFTLIKRYIRVQAREYLVRNDLKPVYPFRRRVLCRLWRAKRLSYRRLGRAVLQYRDNTKYWHGFAIYMNYHMWVLLDWYARLYDCHEDSRFLWLFIVGPRYHDLANNKSILGNMHFFAETWTDEDTSKLSAICILVIIQLFRIIANNIHRRDKYMRINDDEYQILWIWFMCSVMVLTILLTYVPMHQTTVRFWLRTAQGVVLFLPCVYSR